MEEYSLFKLEDKGVWDGEAVFLSDIILIYVNLEDLVVFDEEFGFFGIFREVEEDVEEGCVSADSGELDECVDFSRFVEGDIEDVGKDLSESEGLVTGI